MELKEIQEILKKSDVDSIRVDFADLYGICRSKLMPVSRLEATIEEGLNFAEAVYCIDLANNIAPGTGCGEESGWVDMTIRLDLSTFAVLPHQPHTARIIGDAYRGNEPHPVDPRGALRKILKKYEERGLRAVAASELEFMLFDPANNGESYNTAPSCVYQVNPAIDKVGILRQIQNTCLDLGFDMIYLNHEFFPGQFEVNWKYADAMKMADQSFTFKYVCKELAIQNNLHLTFMGRPKTESGGNGYHMHFSLNDIKTGKNVFDDPNGKDGMSDLQLHFVGGLLKHAKGMSALLAPTVNSYKRYVQDAFAPYFIAWGGDNRTVYCRIPAERGRASRVENRAACASANPYLVMAANLAAGLDGIKNKIDPGEPAVGDIYHDESGKYENVPFYLRDAIEELKKSTMLRDALSPELIKAFVALKEHEINRFRTTVTDWEFKEYSYHL